MRELKRPNYPATQVFGDCIKIKRNKTLRARLQTVTSEITNAEDQYKQKAKILALHEIKRTNGVGACVSTKEMEDLYDNVFARKSSPVRKDYYDKLMMVPENGVCPLCGQRDVSTLDHYLPKAEYPSLAVTPINLVPACQECNHTKLQHFPKSDDQQLIHPYFDVLPAGIWLVADLEHSRPPALKYRISIVDDCDKTITKRLTLHFEKFELAKLYASQAATILSGIAGKLAKAWARGGETEVKFVLTEDADSWSEHHKNCWQAALYRTLADSEWFCEEGFAYVGERVGNDST
ncbi:HNH endonuclease [Burkholderia sp. BE17]|uniref:HNH endonuclease n=1 Tax=Burkholderia sp. BE17 TaxID=2656644 RepID=UPI00128B66F0|nr:hypothetical protein [Burkholderia sp. BE17]MPV71429.1 hypothetical protein [Burkholderia sp. BE17]